MIDRKSKGQCINELFWQNGNITIFLGITEIILCALCHINLVDKLLTDFGISRTGMLESLSLVNSSKVHILGQLSL